MAGQALTEKEIAARLSDRPGWTFDGTSIRRSWKTASFKATMMAANAVAHLCELAWHHPTMVVTYGVFEVRLDTHDAGGVTDKDFALAAKIDALLDWRPGEEGGPLGGAPRSDPTAAYFK